MYEETRLFKVTPNELKCFSDKQKVEYYRNTTGNQYRKCDEATLSDVTGDRNPPKDSLQEHYRNDEVVPCVYET